jgi:oxygen-independent coproporphyrinogen-3 oxidase
MAGIYVHIPFCKQRCTYCDFHFSTSFSSYRSKMIDGICQELKERSNELTEEIKTIYFGGGTPSLLTIMELQQIMQSIKDSYQLAAQIECSLEANPDDISDTSLADWRSVGINRLSIGIQSFREEDLRWMNRAHNAEESAKCIGLATKAGITSISMDLIYGIESMSHDEWREQIRKALTFDVEHISAYCLTVESGTALDAHVRKGKMKKASEEHEAEQFSILRKELTGAGYEHYEVSNFAKPGKYSKHNSSYWKNELFVGVGPSAHSYSRSHRRFNIANNGQYLKKIQAGEVYWETEELSTADLHNEIILTGLRTTWGVQKKDIKLKANDQKHFTEKLTAFISDELVFETETHYRLSEKGFLLADYIASELFID